MLQATYPALNRNLLILESRESILALAPSLEKLAARCGQQGAMHWLPYFLDKAVLGRRMPRLVLFLKPEEDQADSLSADHLEAAALLFEYKVAGLKTGVVATGDAVGFNSVIAPSEQRARVAADAAQAFLARGAAIVLATYESSAAELRPQTLGSPSTHSSWRKRAVGRMLPLRGSLDATLAQMGKTTRFNLRYYRRRLEKQIGCEYIADAAAMLTEEDMKSLNAGCLNPVPESELERRVAAASRLSGSFLSGLRAADGRWLSLVGGWRQDGTTVLHWQMNARGFEKHSIGTVMRSFLLEHEIARGARSLFIYGGTPHPMRSAFAQDQVADLILERPGARAWTVRVAARVMASRRVFPRGNFVAEAICCAQELSQESPVTTPATGTGLLKPLGSRQVA